MGSRGSSKSASCFSVPTPTRKALAKSQATDVLKSDILRPRGSKYLNVRKLSARLGRLDAMGDQFAS
jgi:hypothetical protein